MFGRWDVDRFMEEMDSSLFQRWIVFLTLEPDVGDREDRNVARLLAQLHNIHRDSDSPPAKVDDYLVDYWSDEMLYFLQHGRVKPKVDQLLDAFRHIPGVTITDQRKGVE